MALAAGAHTMQSIFAYAEEQTLFISNDIDEVENERTKKMRGTHTCASVAAGERQQTNSYCDECPSAILPVCYVYILLFLF